MTGSPGVPPRSRRHRARAVTVSLLAAASVLSACSSAEEVEPPERWDGDTLFAPDSPWNSPIPEDPVLDEGSEGMVDALAEESGATALLYEFGVPIYQADADTPEVDVTCTRDWGECPVEAAPVRIPEEARASAGSDGALVVVDLVAGRSYDFWQAEPSGDGNWTVSWGTWASLDGDGMGGKSGGEGGGASGAGINLLAGVVRTEEIREGRIDHALAFASDLSCPDEYRYPATKTDGHATSRPCVPQGARLQLDPSIDVTAIPGITPAEVTVAQALQTHGGYLRDSAESALAVAFERPEDGDTTYEDAGFPWDFYDMPHIPWEDLRVLRQWDGG